MLRNNICKFIPESQADEREIFSFVFEQKREAMEKSTRLEYNRAILISSGEIRIHINDTERKYSAGDLLFCFEGEIVSGKPESDTSYQYIDYKGTRTDSLMRRFSVNRENRSFKGFDGVIPLWKESLTRADEENLDLAAESMLLYVFSRLNSQTQERTNVINEVITYSERCFTNASLSLSSVAENLNYSPKYISHLFKRVMGVSYTEYLRVLRIKYATSLLDHGIDSIKNVAVLSGYSDPLYFSTVFKNTVGMSPKDYLRTKNGEDAAGQE